MTEPSQSGKSDESPDLNPENQSVAGGVTGAAAVDFAAVDTGVVTGDDEGLFARDVDGQLIRVERATADELDELVTLTIDGVRVTVHKAQPTRDSQGNVLRDADGEPIPRPTTIYDAASVAFVKEPGDAHPISALCHKEHLPPVGVCRVCVVEATEMTRRGPRKKLVPSCVQRVTDGMEIHTTSSGADPQAAARVKVASSTIVELLLADHEPADPQSQPGNELVQIAQTMGIGQSRFAAGDKQRGRDLSSRMIAVDHDQCIMCGRCVRGCNWIKGNDVIGRAEKGYESRIAFDLDEPMASSSCVSCGECAISCPTGALQFQPKFIETQKERVRNDMVRERQDGDIVTADELQNYPIFAGVPYKFLQFNAAAVVRRILQPGDVLCREGEYGSTAFLIMSGRFEVFLSTVRGAVRNASAGGIRGFFGGIKTFVEKVGGAAHLADVGGSALSEDGRIFITSDDVIVGEMTCLNRYPRSATVVATEPTEVLEIKRNVLFMLQRNAVSREILDRVYRKHSLGGQLEGLSLLSNLSPADRDRAVEFLRGKVGLVTVDPGQVIFRQGDRADNLYITRLGFVKVSQSYGREDRVLNYIGPGNAFGEIGLLSALDPSVPGVSDLHQSLLGPDGRIAVGPASGTAGIRTATCSALDHVELIRIRGSDFRDLLREFPELAPPLIDQAREILERDRDATRHLQTTRSEDFLEQGLYLAQSLLVLDLERCTRCDECTKACADTHDGVTRLVRDGLRFDKFLVASSCRSCMDPYCLVGCPVDAIHRNGGSLEIEIEDYCIGCGLCADNCPYGNINMHGFDKVEINQKGKFQKVYQIDGKRKVPVIQQRATTCDLCRSVDGKPSCVYACPHDAAFRMTGTQLMNLVEPS